MTMTSDSLQSSRGRSSGCADVDNRDGLRTTSPLLVSKSWISVEVGAAAGSIHTRSIVARKKTATTDRLRALLLLLCSLLLTVCGAPQECSADVSVVSRRLLSCSCVVVKTVCGGCCGMRVLLKEGVRRCSDDVLLSLTLLAVAVVAAGYPYVPCCC